MRQVEHLTSVSSYLLLLDFKELFVFYVIKHTKTNKHFCLYGC